MLSLVVDATAVRREIHAGGCLRVTVHVEVLFANADARVVLAPFDTKLRVSVLVESSAVVGRLRASLADGRLHTK